MRKSFYSDGNFDSSVHIGAAEPGLAKRNTQIIVEIIEYIPHVVVSKTVIKKNTDNITVSSFLEGNELVEKNAPFDTYIQIIEGTAELCINNRDYILHMGNGIIIPAHSTHYFNANVQFKMLSTIIRSDNDYE